MTAPHAHAPAPSARGLPHDDAVVRAAQWLADNPRWETGMRRRLREQFAIDDSQIADAVDLAGDMRLLRRVFG